MRYPRPLPLTKSPHFCSLLGRPRHTFCTLLAEREVPIEVIKDLAGHADMRATERYTHVSDHRRDQAIASLDHGCDALHRASDLWRRAPSDAS